MILLVKIKNHRITLTLKQEGKVIDELSWQDQRDLLDKLLPGIDQLLGRNGLKPEELEGIEDELKANESHSSYRIAKATVETLKMGLGKNP